MSDLYLASQSPRRRELLTQIGVSYSVLTVNVPEQRRDAETPEAYVLRLAREKSECGWQQCRAENLPCVPVLGADTVVLVAGRVLEKPKDREDALQMMASLSGCRHDVLTAVALTSERGSSSVLSSTQVTFRAVSPAEALRYWQTGEPLGKAGGYGVQGLGAVFVEHLAGSYSGVVGLPLAQTQQLLEQHGVAIWGEPYKELEI